MVVEVFRDLGVGGDQALAELVRRDVDHLYLDALVALLELADDVGVSHRHPARDRRLKLLGDDAAPDLVLELVGTHRGGLHPEQLAVALVADELAVILEGGQRQDALADLGITCLDPEARGFGQRRLFLDHLLHDPLVDPQLFQQLVVDVGPVGLPVGLHLLLVDAAEVGGGDLAAFDVGDDRIAGGPRGSFAHEAGDVEEDKRDDHNREAPFEPALVSAHPVEHCHGCRCTSWQKTRLWHGFDRFQATSPVCLCAIFTEDRRT